MPILVTPSNILTFAGRDYRCALGRGGIIAAADKREGDGATPAGSYPIRALWYRADKITLPTLKIPTHAIAPDDGWCDDPSHPDYNRPIKKPFAVSHEEMWRADDRYDLVIVLGHNDNPPVPGMGSCIFWHVAEENFAPTAGCVAMTKDDLLEILPHLQTDDWMTIASD